MASEDGGVIAFAGLGAMGYHMAGHMAKKFPGCKCLVWNRTSTKAATHSVEHGSVQATDFLMLQQAKVLVLCLPTSSHDAEVAMQVAPGMSRGSCIVSCTSGDPLESTQLGKTLKDQFGLHFVDCPVSGGPRGAEAATLTCMLGADDEAAFEVVEPILHTFSKKIVRCGPVGSGHAVKAMNNALNVTHLMLGAEGLLALKRFGVDPKVALDAINGSSGRSLQTEQRLPQEVITGRFEYGFKLSLMSKDCRIARSLLEANYPSATLLPAAMEMVQRAEQEEVDDVDYTHVVKVQERKACIDLRSKPY